MKKLIVLLCVTVCLFAIPTAVSATTATKTYKIQALNLKVDLPKDWLVVTCDTPKNDTVYDKLGKSYDKMQQDMKKYNAYVDLFDPSKNYEIAIFKISDNGKSYDNNFKTDVDLECYMQDTIHANNNRNYTNHYQYNHPQSNFCVFEEQDKNRYEKEYWTSKNGHLIVISLSSNNGPFPASVNNVQKDIVDSIHFNSLQEQINLFLTPKLSNLSLESIITLWRKEFLKQLTIKWISHLIALPFILVILSKQKKKDIEFLKSVNGDIEN
jgi:hypothetical protein